MPSSVSAATAPFQLDSEWGSPGTGPGQFVRPVGIDTNAAGEVFVGDIITGSIQRFSSDGQLLARWGGRGTLNGEFSALQDIALDGFGNVYALDLLGNRVQRFDASGNFIVSWALPPDVATVTNSLPVEGIATDAEGLVYIASPEHAAVIITDAVGNEQRRLTAGSNGALDIPTGITVNTAATVYVFDTFNRRIQPFDVDGVALSAIRGTETPDQLFRSLARGDVEVDAAGNIYVADFANARIHRFRPDGSLESSFIVRDSTGRRVLAGGIALDSSGNLYVTAYYLGKVLKFTPTS